MLDLISIGDVTEDVFVEVDDAAKLMCDHHSHRCFLQFPFGSKLGIKKVFKLIGGNAGNVAIGAKRLGFRSALVAQVGDDTPGKVIATSLQKEKVSMRYFFLKKGEKTNYSVILYFKGERTILVHHEPRRYRFPPLEKAKWVYLTSMARGNQVLFKPLLSYLRSSKALMAFNPGTYQLNLGLKKLEPLLQRTAVLFVNLEEAQSLLKTKGRDVPFLLEGLHRVGPKGVVITDGENGSYCFDGKGLLYCPIYEVPPLERTGCGDAYAAGFVCALMAGNPFSEAMRWGSINSASVLERIGPQEGLIRKSFILKVLRANPTFCARSFSGREVLHDRQYFPKKYKKF